MFQHFASYLFALGLFLLPLWAALYSWRQVRSRSRPNLRLASPTRSAPLSPCLSDHQTPEVEDRQRRQLEQSRLILERATLGLDT